MPKEILHFTRELGITHMSHRSNLFQIFQHAALSKGAHDPIKELIDNLKDISLLCIYNTGIHCANVSTNPTFMCELCTSRTDDNRAFVALGFQGNGTLQDLHLCELP